MWAFWLACGGVRTERVPGTTASVQADVPAADSEWTLDIRTSATDCLAAGVTDTRGCTPWLDRASGEVHLSFELRDPASGSPMTRSVTPDQVVVLHDGARQNDVELIAHDPVRGGQLFVLVVDGSGSMFEDGASRARALHDALLRAEVVDGFFPVDGGESGVVALRFTDKVIGLDGGAPRIMTRRADYEAAVRAFLQQPGGGYTHLYDAVVYSMTALYQDNAIAAWLASRSSEPTVVALTDGFHNEKSSDLCETNVPRLQTALNSVRAARTNAGLAVRPTLYTVGIGRPYRPGNKPRGLDQTVTSLALCGPYGDHPIDGGIERAGIDHISLEWLAEAGGGIAFARQDASGLASVFRRAAAPRYRWFEVRYRVPDPFWMRRSFETRIQLESSARALTNIRFHPSRWLDAPSGIPEASGRWAMAAPWGRSAALWVSLLALLVLLPAVPTAAWTAWRRWVG